MQRGSYDLVQPSEANGAKAEVADGEGSPLLEMTERSTCKLKEIIEGDAVEPADKGAGEGGGGGDSGGDEVGKKDADTVAPTEDSEEDSEKEEEEVKANGGEELGKAAEVKVEIGPSPQGSGAKGTIWQRCSFSNKILITIVVILALCVFFMAIAWPKEQKGVAAATAKSQAEPQKGVSTVAAQSTAAPSLPSPVVGAAVNATESGAVVNATGDNGDDKTSDSTTGDSGGGGDAIITTTISVPQPEEDTTEMSEIEGPTRGVLGDVEGTPGDGEKLAKIQQEFPETENIRRPCMSSTCRSLASNMLAFMKHSADPCEDFYTYACGGMRDEENQWIAETDPGSETWSRISDGMKLVNESSPRGLRAFKNFYESCVNYEGVSMDTRIKKARNILEDVGRFYKKEEWDGNYGPENFTQLLGNFLLRHYSPFLDLLLDVDSSNSSKFALKLTPPLHQSPFGGSTGSGSRATLSGWPRESCKRTATAEPKKGETRLLDSRYKEYVECNVVSGMPVYIEDIRTALKALKILNSENEWHDFFPMIEDMLVNMTRIFPTNDDKNRAIASKDFKKYTLNDLLQNDNFSYVDWQSLTTQLTSNLLPNDTEVQVYFESYIKTLFEEISVGDPRQWNNVLMAMFAHELYYGLVDHSACNREDYCLTVAGNLMSDAASALFLNSFLPEELSTFLEKIKSTFSDIINILESEISYNMVKEPSSTRAVETKVQGIGLIADGGVPIFQNNSYLNSLYGKYKEEVTYLENAVSLLQQYRMKMYQSYNKNPSNPEQIWLHFLDPYSSKAHAIVELNKIVVPYGMMQKPFFNEYYPSYIQMARLGRVIAKEMWMLLSKIGIQQHIPSVIKKGLLESIPRISGSRVFDSNEAELFFEKSPSLQEGVAIIKKRNGTLYMSDLLADCVAVYLTYSSIWRNDTEEIDTNLPWIDLSPKQLYFLAIAQTSCTKSSVYEYAISIFEDLQLPPFIQVNDIAKNSPQFLEAFRCPSSKRTESRK